MCWAAGSESGVRGGCAGVEQLGQLRCRWILKGQGHGEGSGSGRSGIPRQEFAQGFQDDSLLLFREFGDREPPLHCFRAQPGQLGDRRRWNHRDFIKIDVVLLDQQFGDLFNDRVVIFLGEGDEVVHLGTSSSDSGGLFV